MIQNHKLEQSVLACMLIDNECAEEYGLLEIDDFTILDNQKTFYAIKNLVKNNKAIDYMTVYEETKQDVELTYLMNLAEVMPSVINFKSYVEQLKDLTLKRKLYKLADELKDRDKKGQEIAELAEERIFNLQESNISGEFVQARDLAMDTLNYIQNSYDGKVPTGINTGYQALDRILRGMQGGDYILLAGRPSMGKTALSINITENLILNNKTVAFFSLEMPNRQIMQRMLLGNSLTPANKLSDKKMDKYDWERLSNSMNSMLNTKLYLEDDSSKTVAEMNSMCRRLKRRVGLDIVIIDYLQQIQATAGGNRREQVEQISRDLKRMAKDLDVPVIVVSSLSRANQMREDKRPILSDLRESGQIEFDADMVLFVHREEYYEPTPENKGKAEVIIAKHRNGPTGIARLGWISEFTKFVDITDLETRY
ncbi:MAG TPA: replicative DNA helicase [Tissierellales bacterium]|nr:replicative DNA helicase [Tissierellales bacterium]